MDKPNDRPIISDSSENITIQLNEKRLAIPRGSTVFTVRDHSKSDADVLILNSCPLTEDVVLEEGDALVLIKRGEAPSPEELESLITARHGRGVYEKLKGARVGIAGCGGLGSTVAVALARIGVGELLLVDFDVVEPSNINRQQFFLDQIGERKVEALTANLARINPLVRLTPIHERLTRSSIPRVFAHCDVIAECFDDPRMKQAITLAARKELSHIPLVTVSGIAGYGPSDAIRIRRVFDNVYLIGDGESGVRPGVGLLAPRVAVAAGHQANVIVRLILEPDQVVSDDVT